MGSEGTGSQVGGTTLRVAEKGICGGFPFVKWFRHLSHQTQQVWSEIEHLFCRAAVGSRGWVTANWHNLCQG